jgi:hypothetical protein
LRRKSGLGMSSRSFISTFFIEVEILTIPARPHLISESHATVGLRFFLFQILVLGRIPVHKYCIKTVYTLPSAVAEDIYSRTE